MFLSYTTLLLLAHSLTLTQGLFLSPRNLSACAHTETPFALWQLFQDPSRQNQTVQIAPQCASVPPYCGDTRDNFRLSQDANAANQVDLLASYRNQGGLADGRCGHGEIKGPYTLEFAFDPTYAYTLTGTNRRLDVFDVNGDVPQMFDGHREYYYVPNWENIGPLTGGLVASFQLPAAGSKAKVIKVLHSVQKVCKEQYNFRLSFTDSDQTAGAVDYAAAEAAQAGLRLYFGC